MTNSKKSPEASVACSATAKKLQTEGYQIYRVYPEYIKAKEQLDLMEGEGYDAKVSLMFFSEGENKSKYHVLFGRKPEMKVTKDAKTALSRFFSPANEASPKTTR